MGLSGQSDANGPAVGNGARVAEADGPGFYGVSGLAADDTLNISSEQTSHAANVGSIPLAPTCVRNLGCRGGLTFQEFGTLNQVAGFISPEGLAAYTIGHQVEATVSKNSPTPAANPMRRISAPAAQPPGPQKPEEGRARISGSRAI